MTFAKFSKAFKFSIALAVLVPAASALAQDAGYLPPPMFEDMTPPMVRPDAKADGMIVTPKSSPNTVLPPSDSPRPAMVAPRVSVDPDAPKNTPPVPPRAVFAPTVPTAPAPAAPPVVAPAPVMVPAAPAVAPVTPPKMMQPIIEETPAKPVIKTEKKKTAVTPVVPPKKPAAPAAVQPKAETPPAPPIAVPAPVVSAPALEKAAEVHIPRAPTDEMPVPATPKTPMAPPAVAPVPSTMVPAKPSVDDRTQQPIKRDPQESVIKGPKVMPSLPVQGVEGEVTYQPAPAPTSEQTILERNQKAADETKTEKEIIPIVPAPKENITPATFDRGGQDALKKSIVYQPGQIGLESADADPIAAGVSTELDREENKDWRVQIRSFATPHGTGASSDRRIALSRALSLRTELIKQGVSASRIDVLAEGLQTDASKPGDRIDLYLYGPKKD